MFVSQDPFFPFPPYPDWAGILFTCMADAGVIDFYSHFVGFGGCNFDIFDAEVLAGFPGDRRLGDLSMCELREHPEGFHNTLQVIVCGFV